MKYFVLVMLLSASPALAESWENERPDDTECRADVAGFTIVYTYNSKHPPKAMPIEGLMCFERDYESQAATFTHGTKYFEKYWETLQ